MVVRSRQVETIQQVDLSLLVASDQAGGDFPIDPALYAIEKVVEDVRRGKVRLDKDQSRQDGRKSAGEQVAQAVNSFDTAVTDSQEITSAVNMEDDGIDPALREIVNSLTNAQQVRSRASVPLSG